MKIHRFIVDCKTSDRHRQRAFIQTATHILLGSLYLTFRESCPQKRFAQNPEVVRFVDRLWRFLKFRFDSILSPFLVSRHQGVTCPFRHFEVICKPHSRYQHQIPAIVVANIIFFVLYLFSRNHHEFLNYFHRCLGLFSRSFCKLKKLHSGSQWIPHRNIPDPAFSLYHTSFGKSWLLFWALFWLQFSCILLHSETPIPQILEEISRSL